MIPQLVPPAGFGANGADDGIRTRDPHLGNSLPRVHAVRVVREVLPCQGFAFLWFVLWSAFRPVSSARDDI